MDVKKLKALRKTILAGDKARARRMLKVLAQEMPDCADVYYYGAFVAANTAQAEQFLQRALALDAMHTGANRTQHQLAKAGLEAVQQSIPAPPQQAAATPTQTLETQTITQSQIIERRRNRSRRWVTMSGGRLAVFGVSALVLALSSTWLLMLLLGFGSRYVNGLLGFIGAPETISEYDGQPIQEFNNPAELTGLGASHFAPLERGEGGATGEVMRAGAMHQYDFEGRIGEELAVAVQFFSPFAKNVKENVAIRDPNGNLAGERCFRQFILDEQTGVVFICNINIEGQWSVRIFGNEGESSGAYVVTAERLS